MRIKRDKPTFTPVQITIDNQVEMDVLLDALRVYANDRALERAHIPLYNGVPNKDIAFAIGEQIASDFVTAIIDTQIRPI